MRNGFRLIVGVVVLSLMMVSMNACTKRVSARDSALTPGMAKKHIYPGKTTQAEVLEIFGPPELVTHKYGKEVWTYDKVSHEMTSSGGFLTILLAGYSRSSQRSSTRTTMLIVYFDKNEVVKDYKLSAARF